MQPLHDNSGPKGHLAVLVILQICRTRQPSEVGTQSDEDPARPPTAAVALLGAPNALDYDRRFPARPALAGGHTLFFAPLAEV